MDPTVTRMNNPGHSASNGARCINSCALVSMFPQDGVGGFTPSPRKDKAAS